MNFEDTAALVVRLQRGDEAAFDEIFAAYRKQAVRTAFLISGDAALAEDIAQEAFVLCLLNIRSLRDPLRFRPWFFRTLTRCAWKFMEKRGRDACLDESAQRMLPPETDVYPSDRRGDYETLYRAMDGLGRKQRATVILHYFSGLSIREIAAATSAPEATVKTRLFAARNRLRKALERKEEKGS